MRKFLIGVGLVLLVLVVGGAIYVSSRQHLTFDAPYPAVAASTDSAVIARGRYIVRDLAPCASCHGAPSERQAAFDGAEVALSGGFFFDIPPGKFYAKNLTSDAATGLGSVPDSAIARAIRYGVGHDGRALLPFMEMQGLSDDDLVAVVSYLRTLPPTDNAVPAHEPNVLGKVILATVLSDPVGPASTPPVVAPRGATIENGKYLAGSVALCWACHSPRSEMTGALTGAMYSGTTGFIEADDPEHEWAPPNLTPDPETGVIARMTEDQFVARFRQGRIIPKSPMPWQGFSRLADDDLRAIYKYLMSLPPVKNDVGPAVIEVGKKS